MTGARGELRLVALTASLLALVIAGCGGGASTTDTTAGGAAARARHHRHHRPSAPPVLVAALGDSLSAGAPLWDPDPTVRAALGNALNRESQYEYWAAQHLGSNVQFRNCGAWDQRTDQIVQRLDGCAQGAQYLIVQGGLADIAQGRSVADAGQNLQQMVERGKQLGLSVELAEVPPWNGGFPGSVAIVQQLDARIDAIARYERVPLVALYGALQDPNNPGRMPNALTIDGDNLSVEGYRTVGEMIRLSPRTGSAARTRAAATTG